MLTVAMYTQKKVILHDLSGEDYQDGNFGGQFKNNLQLGRGLRYADVRQNSELRKESEFFHQGFRDRSHSKTRYYNKNKHHERNDHRSSLKHYVTVPKYTTDRYHNVGSSYCESRSNYSREGKGKIFNGYSSTKRYDRHSSKDIDTSCYINIDEYRSSEEKENNSRTDHAKDLTIHGNSREVIRTCSNSSCDSTNSKTSVDSVSVKSRDKEITPSVNPFSIFVEDIVNTFGIQDNQYIVSINLYPKLKQMIRRSRIKPGHGIRRKTKAAVNHIADKEMKQNVKTKYFVKENIITDKEGSGISIESSARSTKGVNDGNGQSDKESNSKKGTTNTIIICKNGSKENASINRKHDNGSPITNNNETNEHPVKTAKRPHPSTDHVESKKPKLQNGMVRYKRSDEKKGRHSEKQSKQHDKIFRFAVEETRNRKIKEVMESLDQIPSENSHNDAHQTKGSVSEDSSQCCRQVNVQSTINQGRNTEEFDNGYESVESEVFSYPIASKLIASEDNTGAVNAPMVFKTITNQNISTEYKVDNAQKTNLIECSPQVNTSIEHSKVDNNNNKNTNLIECPPQENEKFNPAISSQVKVTHDQDVTESSKADYTLNTEMRSNCDLIPSEDSSRNLLNDTVPPDTDVQELSSETNITSTKSASISKEESSGKNARLALKEKFINDTKNITATVKIIISKKPELEAVLTDVCKEILRELSNNVKEKVVVK